MISHYALIVCQTNEQVNRGCSFHSPKHQPQKLCIRKVSARPLADKDYFQPRTNYKPLAMRAAHHHHVSRRVIADANTGPLRVLPRQIEHSLHIDLASVWRLLIQPQRKSVRRVRLRTDEYFSQQSCRHDLASMVITISNHELAQSRPFARG